MTLDFAEDLRATVTAAATRLAAIPPERARASPAPGKWSPAEILGHLIDSASHNHRRFVGARLGAGLRFEGYEQDAWVETQAYRSAPWSDLVALWLAYNLHIARVMASTPRAVLDRPRPEHNLHEIAWETVPETEPVTLAYFMRDYVGHLKHHLRQIDPALAAAPLRQRAP